MRNDLAPRTWLGVTKTGVARKLASRKGGEPYDDNQDPRRGRDPCIRIGEPGHGAAGHQPGNYQRQAFADQVYRQSWQPGRTATIAGMTAAASDRAMPRPAPPQAPRPRWQSNRSAAKNMPAATASSASPAPCSAAKTAAGTSANRTSGSRREKGGRKAGFFCAGVMERLSRCWPFPGKSGIRPPKIGGIPRVIWAGPPSLQFAGLAQR